MLNKIVEYSGVDLTYKSSQRGKKEEKKKGLDSQVEIDEDGKMVLGNLMKIENIKINKYLRLSLGNPN